MSSSWVWSSFPGTPTLRPTAARPPCTCVTSSSSSACGSPCPLPQWKHKTHPTRRNASEPKPDEAELWYYYKPAATFFLLSLVLTTPGQREVTWVECLIGRHTEPLKSSLSQVSVTKANVQVCTLWLHEVKQAEPEETNMKNRCDVESRVSFVRTHERNGEL